ncbi:MAG: hypothetical protein NC102_07410 [Clostridium sp.]|nr:hypothetical protein [Clostridium sp.]
MALFILASLAMACCQRGGVRPDASVFPVRGIDISAHNGDVDFASVAADSIRFVYIKATEGADFCDALFERNCQRALSAGMDVGAYHFFRFDTPGHIQAYNFMNAIEGKRLVLPAAIDVEDWNNAEDVPVKDVVDQLASMVGVLKSAGRKVVIYTNKKGYESYIKERFDSVQVWMCSLDAEPSDSVNWKFWQYSHSGRLHGLAGNVDLDVFRGSRADYDAYLAPDSTFSD